MGCPLAPRLIVAVTASALCCGTIAGCAGSVAPPAPKALSSTSTGAASIGVAPAPVAAVPVAAVPVVVTALTARARAERAYAAMTPAQRVGQLVMAGVPTTGSNAKQRATLRRHAVGNVYLAGNSKARAAKVRAAVTSVRRATTVAGARPYISVDQEGGQVQRLSGPGFSRMPTALKQGRLSTKALQARARAWGRQLADAGINLDLAPVADVVPAKRARSNQPIGRYQREYGHTSAKVSPKVAAFVRGMRAGGVSTSVKHFPGLGRASGNTDFAKRVTDPTTRRSPYLRPFRAGVDAGSPFVMVSSATYPNIDPGRRACFSPTVIRTMLRGDLGFDGVVVSDDLGAASLKHLPWGTRATRFVDAGGTMLLTVGVTHVGAMTKAVHAKAAKDTAFAAKVRAAVMTVLVAKARAGLLG